MGSRRKGRELALQVLYLVDVTSFPKEKVQISVLKNASLEKKSLDFFNTLIDGTLTHIDELDRMIIQYSENWEIKRMAAVDRNILRLGAYELIYEIDTPISVIIDEAVEIAKIYSTHDSGKFVNGILDKIKKKRKKEKHEQIENAST
ncbi:transcription antitermination factor NusB [bacterium F11]|nr:transcription antitermination factor NusB [bacterium F11]